MNIKTITCHDVYNVGASLQAFALQEYLSELGHDVEIIDYKPDYLSKHYSLFKVNNQKYNKPLLREIYIFLKLGKRIKALRSGKKQAFDLFTKQYLKRTNKRYRTFADLKNDPPEADLYIAGSDQIWNPLFKNGKDPAFFLDFVPKDKGKASYAASFAVEDLNAEDQIRMKNLLSQFDYISVRECSALKLIESMSLIGTHVCDPVFLLDSNKWQELMIPFVNEKKYIFVYDFDSNEIMHERIRNYAKQKDLGIVSAFPFEGGRCVNNLGPLEFLGVINNSTLVISNSFHATAFSIIFHKPFLVFDRHEQINTRMHDLVRTFGMEKDTFIKPGDQIILGSYSWDLIDERRVQFVGTSKEFLNRCIEEKNRYD